MTNFNLRTAALALAAFAAAAPAQADGHGDGYHMGGDWLIRVRALGVLPDEDQDLSLAGLNIGVSDAVVPELDISYFFTPNFAAELILGTTPHRVKTSGAAGLNLGKVWLLPPTLTLQYHVTYFEHFKPYVGAGVNYTIFYGATSGDAADIDYENSFGFALQAGVDIPLSDNFYFNVDVKKIWLSTDVTVTGPAVTGSVDLDPWLVGAGFGYRF